MQLLIFIIYSLISDSQVFGNPFLEVNQESIKQTQKVFNYLDLVSTYSQFYEISVRIPGVFQQAMPLDHQGFQGSAAVKSIKVKGLNVQRKEAFDFDDNGFPYQLGILRFDYVVIKMRVKLKNKIKSLNVDIVAEVQDFISPYKLLYSDNQFPSLILSPKHVSPKARIGEVVVGLDTMGPRLRKGLSKILQPMIQDVLHRSLSQGIPLNMENFKGEDEGLNQARNGWSAMDKIIGNLF